MRKIWQERKRMWCRLPLSFTVYTLYEDKFCIQSGLLRREFDDVRLYRVIDVTLRQNILQRLFGLWTVECNSLDATAGMFKIKNILQGQELRELLEERIEISRKENNVATREFYDTM